MKWGQSLKRHCAPPRLWVREDRGGKGTDESHHQCQWSAHISTTVTGNVHTLRHARTCTHRMAWVVHVVVWTSMSVWLSTGRVPSRRASASWAAASMISRKSWRTASYQAFD